MNIRHLSFLLLLPAIAFGVNPGDSGPPGPHKGPPDTDDKCKKESQNGSFMYFLTWGGIPMQSGLDSGAFVLRELQPSPATYTPNIVYYRHPAAVKLADISYTGSFNVSIVGSDSLPIQFTVLSGQSIGMPGGERTGSNQRLLLLDAQGVSVAAAAGVTPAAVRLLYEDGSSVDLDVASKVATKYRSASGRETEFASLPDSVALKFIYKDGVMRQVRSAFGLADIMSLGASGFEIRLYDPANIGTLAGSGLYVPTGSPYRTVFFENPDAPAAVYSVIRVTDTWGTRVKIDIFTYDSVINDWTLARGQSANQSPLRHESKALVPGPNSDEITYHITLADENGKTVSTRDEIYKAYPWGKEKTSETLEPATLNLTTVYVYNTSAPGYGKLEHRINPDESWESYTYDDSGRVLTKSSAWKDSVYSATATSQRGITTYDYTSLDAADTVAATDYRPRTETNSVIPSDGAASIVVGRTYYVFKTDASGQAVEIVENASSATSAFGSATNLRTTKVNYTTTASQPGYSAVAAGRLAYIDKLDGTRTSYTYSQDLNNAAAAYVTATTYATPASPSGVEGLSTRTVESYNLQGYLVRTQSYIYANAAWQATSDQVETPIIDGLITGRTLNGRTTYAASYDGGRLTSETDESGVTTTFAHDSLDKVTTSTRVGVPASGSYAAQSDIVTTYQRSLGGLSCGCDGEVVATISSGGLFLTSTSRKDQTGRPLYEKNEAGLETNYVYTLGGRQVTRINPDVGTVVILKFRDGQVQSESGTGTDAKSYDYGVNTDGTQWTQTTLGSRVVRSTTDFLGRAYKDEQPAFGGGTIVTVQTYDIQGRVAGTSKSHIAADYPTAGKLVADTLNTYDDLGNLTRTGLDVDGDGVLTPASNDRITDLQTSFAQYESAWWLVHKTLVYPTQGSAASVQISEARQRLSGFSGNLDQDALSLDIFGNLTRQKTSVDFTNHLITQTLVRTDSNITATRVNYNGRLISENSSTVSAATTYGYDALGHVVYIKDPRQVHAATLVYDLATGQVTSQKDAAGNATTITYYASGVAGAGRPSVATDALGKTQRMAYDLQGRVIRRWGTSALPQAITYNSFGQMATSATWRTTDAANIDVAAWPNLSTGDVTSWTYDPATGLLTKKTYADGCGPDYTYDLANRLLTRKWARSVASVHVTTTYGYDSITGEQTSITYSDATPNIAITYDRLGRQATIADAAGIRVFAFDPATLVPTTETLPSSYFGSRILTYDYQMTDVGMVAGRSAGFRLGTEAEPGQDYSISYGYDAQGRFVSAMSGAGTFNYAYILNSNLLATLTGPKVRTTYTHEPDRDVITEISNSVGSTTISRYAYSVDAIGRRTSRVQDGSAFSTTTYDRFGYDSRNEVTESLNYTGANPADYVSTSQNSALARLYSYDLIGNRLTSMEGTAPARSYTPNALNQYTAITSPNATPVYDLDGNQTADGSEWYYTWDAENRLVTVCNYAAAPLLGSQKIDYVYDFQSRRIRRTFSTYSGSAWSVADDRKFVYDRWNLVAEFQIQNSSFALLNSYTWGLDLSESINAAGGVGGLLAVSTYSSAAIHFCATYDGNGNVSEYVNGAGLVEAHFAYDVFGQTTSNTGTNLGRFTYRFSTKYLESQTGFYYYGLRYYNPNMGRWLSRDPIEEQGGVNLYGLVNNDPISFVDIDGRGAYGAALGGALGAVGGGYVGAGVGGTVGAVGGGVGGTLVLPGFGTVGGAWGGGAAGGTAGALVGAGVGAVVGAVVGSATEDALILAKQGIDSIKDLVKRYRCRRMQDRMKSKCNGISCSCNDSCGDLSRKIDKAKECGKLRQQITDYCFNGVSDQGHIDQIAQAKASELMCKAIYGKKCAN